MIFRPPLRRRTEPLHPDSEIEHGIAVGYHRRPREDGSGKEVGIKQPRVLKTKTGGIWDGGGGGDEEKVVVGGGAGEGGQREIWKGSVSGRI